MKIRTVADLRKFLNGEDASPETFAKEAKISGMTVRRWLHKPSAAAIPEKYYPNLDRITEIAVSSDLQAVLRMRVGSSFDGLLSDLEESGKNVRDLEKLRKDARAKFKDKNIGTELKEQVNLVLKSIVSKTLPAKYKALCIGALLYFINPIDLIPDAIPVVGYLDDFAVLTLVVGLLVRQASESSDAPGKA